MITEYPLNGKGEKGFIPCFNPSQVVREFDVIAYEDQLSTNFLVAKIRGDLEGVKRKTHIPYDEIPRRLVARIWLLKICMNEDKLV